MDKTELLLQIQNRLKSNNIKCSICTNDFKVENEVYVIPVWDQDNNRLDPNRGHIGALAICTQCGFSITFILAQEIL